LSKRPLRDELRDVFDSLSEPAHPALSARIREDLGSRSAIPTRVPRLAAAVAMVAAIVIVVSLVSIARHGTFSPGPARAPAGRPTPIPSTAASPQPGAGVTPTPAPGVSASIPVAGPPFSCAAESGGGTGGTPAGVTAVRAGPQAGYDRFVIELNGPVQQYQVAPQFNATFTRDASGAPVTLAGSAGLRVTLHGAQAAGTYTGPTDLEPAGTGVLQEARQVGDFEGVVTWGLGLSRASCFRAFTLTGPSRLVVDVQT
jgi:hypothetical protein